MKDITSKSLLGAPSNEQTLFGYDIPCVNGWIFLNQEYQSSFQEKIAFTFCVYHLLLLFPTRFFPIESTWGSGWVVKVPVVDLST